MLRYTLQVRMKADQGYESTAHLADKSLFGLFDPIQTLDALTVSSIFCCIYFFVTKTKTPLKGLGLFIN